MINFKSIQTGLNNITTTAKKIGSQNIGTNTISNVQQATDTVCIGGVTKNKLPIDTLIANLTKIKDKSGKEFVDDTYRELVKYFDLQEIAPDKITWQKTANRPFVGDYNAFDNSLVLYEDYFFKMNKTQQVGILAHELTHCKQLTNILRTEGIPLQKVAAAYAMSDLKALLTYNPKAKTLYAQAKQAGKEQEFIKNILTQKTKLIYSELAQAHSKTLSLPKHSLNSENGLKAQKDLIALYNYNGADSKSYQESILEKEAFEIEKMIKLVATSAGL